MCLLIHAAPSICFSKLAFDAPVSQLFVQCSLEFNSYGQEAKPQAHYPVGSPQVFNHRNWGCFESTHEFFFYKWRIFYPLSLSSPSHDAPIAHKVSFFWMTSLFSPRSLFFVTSLPQKSHSTITLNTLCLYFPASQFLSTRYLSSFWIKSCALAWNHEIIRP